MEFIVAKLEDLRLVKNFYDDVIENTDGLKTYACWKKDVYPSLDILREYIKRRQLYVAKENEKIVCSVAITDSQGEDYNQIKWQNKLADDEVAVVHILAVAPHFQKRGIAKSAICFAIEYAKAKNKKAVRLDALASNLPAQKLYTKYGFVYSGTQKQYADNTGVSDFNYYEYLL